MRGAIRCGETGGESFARGHLSKLLGNPLYVGRLRHMGQVYEGQHAAIVDEAMWQAVQDRLAANHHRHYRARAESAHLLAGRLRDAAAGESMLPSQTQKGTLRYRYYVARTVGLDGKRLRLAAAAVLAGLSGIRCTEPCTDR